jgi:hypothetical protein
VNQGISGGGNERIFYLLMKDLREKKLRKTDAVVVQWTGPYRFDYLTKNQVWMAYGNIIDPDNKHAKAIWHRIRAWYNPDYELEKTRNYVNTTLELLKTYGLKKVYLSLSDLTDAIPKSSFLEHDMFNTYKGGYKFKGNTFVKDSPFTDDHPTLLEHLEIANKVAERINTKISQNAIDLVHKVHNDILNDRMFVDRSLQPTDG